MKIKDQKVIGPPLEYYEIKQFRTDLQKLPRDLRKIYNVFNYMNSVASQTPETAMAGKEVISYLKLAEAALKKYQSAFNKMI